MLRQQADSAPVPSITPLGSFTIRSISSGGYGPNKDTRGDSSAPNVTVQTQAAYPELSSGSAHQSSGDDTSSQYQQPLPAAKTAQGSGSSGSISNGQPGQQEPSDSFISPVAVVAAAPAPAGPLASHEAAPAAVSDPLPAPVGTAASAAAGAAAGAAAVPPQMQPLRALEAAAAAQPAAAVQDEGVQSAAAVCAPNPFGDAAAKAGAAAAAAAAALPAEAAQAPSEQVTLMHLVHSSASEQGAGPTAVVAQLLLMSLAPLMPPVSFGFSEEEEEMECGAGLPPPADAGPAADADAGVVWDLQLCVLGNMFHIDESWLGLISKDGSFGTVYQGTYYGTPVAVKKLKPEYGEDIASMQNRAEEEGEALRAVQHDGVVRFLAVCLDPPCIVMEKCLCNLSDHIREEWAKQPQQQQQQQSWAVVLDFLGQAADALAHIHAPNPTIVIHNDLRAANILLTHSETEPFTWRLKIGDFGSAKRVPAKAAAAPAARAKWRTDARWVAPEVTDWVSGEDGGYLVTPAADVYALGCVLYEMMLVNTLPARAEGEQYTFPAAQQRLPGLRDNNPPAGLEQLFALCVSLEQSNRPTAAEVRDWFIK